MLHSIIVVTSFAWCFWAKPNHESLPKVWWDRTSWLVSLGMGSSDHGEGVLTTTVKVELSSSMKNATQVFTQEYSHIGLVQISMRIETIIQVSVINWFPDRHLSQENQRKTQWTVWEDLRHFQTSSSSIHCQMNDNLPSKTNYSECLSCKDFLTWMGCRISMIK